MMTFTFMRHGRSQADDDDVFEGRFDSPLTETGRKQATAVLEKWTCQGRPTYEAVVASPLKRSHSTATIFAEHYGLSVILLDALTEMDGGQLGGMKRSEGNKRFPPPAFRTPYNRVGGGTGESMAQLHARALLAVDQIVQMAKQRCLVVAHGGILNAILRAILEMPIPVDRSGGYFGIGDVGYVDATYDPSVHRWTILGLEGG
jgi:broad specificity phosphatase PhoE